MTEFLRTRMHGIALACSIALLAWLLQQVEIAWLGHAVIEGLVLAILFGMLLRNAGGVPKAAEPGISFVARDVLEFAVALLGASVSFSELLRYGPGLLAAIVTLVAVSLTVSTFVSRRLGLNSKLATLIAVGNSICGNSAIAAVAPVIEATPDDVAAAIAFTAVLGVGVVVLLPLLVPLLALTHYQFGVLAGLSVYAVPQVVAAAAQVSDLSLRVATSVKLVRVLLLGPVVVWYSLRRRRTNAAIRLSKLAPWFVIAFLALAMLRSLGAIPPALGDAMAQTGKLITLTSMAALGLGVNLRSIRTAGARVTLAVLASLAVLITASLLLIQVFGLR